jgi:AraC-like DNA-binding protein
MTEDELLFVGDDWAQDHHDVELMDTAGRRLSKARLPEGVAVAAAHHISVRYLHRLFQPVGTTVGSWIRHRRLERCSRDLAEPALSLRPIHAVGARWGFRHAAEFSRAFRAAYGMPPSDYREAALRAR